MIHPYAQRLREEYLKYANPELAGAMQAYMRGQFPFLGIKTPEREFQYTALSLLDKFSRKAEASHITLLEELITTHSWWDTVDMLAGKLVGRLFARFPALIPDYTERWMSSGNIWLIRTAILFQLNYKQRTDADRLFDMIRRNVDSREFFINKAIGWALRQYAKTDEQAVIRFVEATPLNPLSVREALKHVKR